MFHKQKPVNQLKREKQKIHVAPQSSDFTEWIVIFIN